MRGSFQCPDTGVPIIYSVSRGRVVLDSTEDDSDTEKWIRYAGTELICTPVHSYDDVVKALESVGVSRYEL